MKSSFARIISIVAAAFALGGCASYPFQPADRRITISPELGESVWVTKVTTAVGAQSRHIEMRANLINYTDSLVKLEYKTVWLNQAGLEIPSAMSVWRFTSLAPREETGIGSIAPTEDASDFRLYIQPPRPGNM